MFLIREGTPRDYRGHFCDFKVLQNTSNSYLYLRKKSRLGALKIDLKHGVLSTVNRVSIFFVERCFGTSMRGIIFATCVLDIWNNRNHSLNESSFSKKVKTVICIPQRRRLMSCEKSSNRNSLNANRDSMLSGSSKPIITITITIYLPFS